MEGVVNFYFELVIQSITNMNVIPSVEGTRWSVFKMGITRLGVAQLIKRKVSFSAQTPHGFES